MKEEDFLIETKRLQLCLISREYQADIFREFTETVARFLINKPTGKIEDTISFIDKSRAASLAGRNCQLVAVNRKTGEFIGCLGVHHLDETPAFGLWIKESAWGQGYGREALSALKSWAKKNLTVSHVLYPVFFDNLRSRRLAESAGGIFQRAMVGCDTRGQETDEIEYFIPL